MVTPRWAPNPFGGATERPPEKPLPITQRPPEVEVPKEPTLPPIPPEGITQTFEGIELNIFEDFEFVGGERRLKSRDYIAYSEGKEVGRFSFETGEFTPRDIPWWEKAGSVVLKGLEKVMATFAEVGIGRKELGQPWYLPTFKNLPASYFTPEAIKSRQIGGETYEEYKKLPFFEQLKYEFPAWLVMSLLPGATKIRGAAQALPAVARVPVRAVLAPVAAYEKAVGFALKQTLGRVTNKVFIKVSEVATRRQLRITAKTLGINLTKETEKTLYQSYKKAFSAHLDAELRAWATLRGAKIPVNVEGKLISYLTTHASPKWAAGQMLAALGKAPVTPTMIGTVAATTAKSAVAVVSTLLDDWIKPPTAITPKAPIVPTGIVPKPLVTPTVPEVPATASRINALEREMQVEYGREISFRDDLTLKQSMSYFEGGRPSLIIGTKGATELEVRIVTYHEWAHLIANVEGLQILTPEQVKQFGDRLASDIDATLWAIAEATRKGFDLAEISASMLEDMKAYPLVKEQLAKSPEVPAVPEVPTELQPIVKEALKYNNIGEFVKANPQLNNETLYSQLRDFAIRNIDKSPQEIQGNLRSEFGEDPTIILYRGISPALKLTPEDTALLGTGKIGKFWSPNPAHSVLFVRVKGELYAVAVKASDLLNRDLSEMAQGEVRLGVRLQENAVKIVPKPSAVTKPPVEPVVALVEAPSIPKELPTTPPALPPEGVTLGRSENEWTGFMADLQEAQTVADVAFRDDVVRKWINLLPEIKGFFNVMNPSAIANTPAEQSVIIRAVLRDEGLQKTQGVTAFLNELGSQEKIFGGLDEKGLIKSGVLKGQSLGDIAEHRSKWETKLTEAQRVWLDRAKVIEDSIIEFLKKNGVEVTQLSLEEGGQFATRRVWARTTKDGSVIDTANVGAGPARPGAKLPTEKHRIFKTEAEAIEAGYRYLPYEEALYLKTSGAYNRVADKKMADWLLSKVPWRTTGAPEELKLAAEQANFKKRHSQQLLSALNRAVRGERVPDITIRSIATSYPNEAQKLKDLIPRIQRGEPTAKEVQNLTGVAKGLVSSNKATAQRAVNARARARERALKTKYGEATIPAPAFAGKILTGPEAKETANALRKTFDPSFSKALGQVNKLNAVSRFFMLAGDFSPFAIQLLFLMGENPVIYSKAFAGSMRALFSTEFHSSYLLKHKATIDKHPNLLLTKSGGTEFTEAMARGGWLSGKTALIPDAENYFKTLGLFLPRVYGKIGATVLTPFQRVFESALDIAGIEMAEAYDYLATTPERTADLDQFINEFRGLTSSARIGVSVGQRQIETALILAPRYNRAIAGLLYDLGRGDLRGSLARKSLAKGVAAIVALAAIISIARGESQEEILDHYNPLSPNFFTWDVVGQKIGPGSKIRSIVKLVAQSADNPDSLFQFSMDNPALRFIRGNLSPVVGSGLDLITGRNYIGDPTRDGMLSFSKEILASRLLPIWVQSVLMEGGDMKGRTVRGVAEFFGGRAYPESVWNEVGRLRDKYAQQDFKVKYEDLNRLQIDRLKGNHPDLKDLEKKAQLEGAKRGTEFEKWVFETRETIISVRDNTLEAAAVALNSNLMSKYDYDKERGYARPYYSGGMSILWLAQESLDAYSVKQIEKWMGENQKPEDKALDEYQKYRADLIQKADLPKDWDKIEAQTEAYLTRFSKATREYIRLGINRWINKLPENAQKVELMRLQGIEDGTWWDNYRDSGTTRTRPMAPPVQQPAPTTPTGGWAVNPFG